MSSPRLDNEGRLSARRAANGPFECRARCMLYGVMPLTTTWVHHAPTLLMVFMTVLLPAIGGCAGMPQRPAMTPSHALESPTSTPLGQLVQRSAPAPRRSGFRLLIAGDDAMDARIAL